MRTRRGNAGSSDWRSCDHSEANTTDLDALVRRAPTATRSRAGPDRCAICGRRREVHINAPATKRHVQGPSVPEKPPSEYQGPESESARSPALAALGARGRFSAHTVAKGGRPKLSKAEQVAAANRRRVRNAERMARV